MWQQKTTTKTKQQQQHQSWTTLENYNRCASVVARSTDRSVVLCCRSCDLCSRIVRRFQKWPLNVYYVTGWKTHHRIINTNARLARIHKIALVVIKIFEIDLISKYFLFVALPAGSKPIHFCLIREMQCSAAYCTSLHAQIKFNISFFCCCPMFFFLSLMIIFERVKRNRTRNPFFFFSSSLLELIRLNGMSFGQMLKSLAHHTINKSVDVKIHCPISLLFPSWSCVSCVLGYFFFVYAFSD